MTKDLPAVNNSAILGLREQIFGRSRHPIPLDDHHANHCIIENLGHIFPTVIQPLPDGRQVNPRAMFHIITKIISEEKDITGEVKEGVSAMVMIVRGQVVMEGPVAASTTDALRALLTLTERIFAKYPALLPTIDGDMNMEWPRPIKERIGGAVIRGVLLEEQVKYASRPDYFVGHGKITGGILGRRKAQLPD